MSDVSKLKINNVTYNIKDSLALRDAPSDGEEYVRKNGAWEISSGGESDSIVFGDDSVIIQPGEGVGFYGDAINFENGSAIITTSERTIKNLWDIVADSFTTTVSYSTDDYVIHEENLYQFITDHPAGEWNDEDVVVTTIEDGLNSDSGGNSSGEGGKAKVMYFYEQTVNTATNAEIFRITDSRINTDTVVLECTFANPEYITGKTSWISYEGYIAFTGTCTTVTTANVTLAYKSEENISNRLFTLLWENLDPTSSFEIQTINLDLSNYEKLLIESRFHTSEQYQYDISKKICNIGTKETLEVIQTPNASTVAYQSSIGTRHVETTSFTIHFFDGKYKNFTTNTYFASDNNYCVPLRIYGISKYTELENLKDTNARASIADNFDETKNYSVGDMVLYDGLLYQFTSAHTGAWNNNDVIATTVSEHIEDSGWKSIANSSVYLASIYYRRIGNILYVQTGDGGNNYIYFTAQKSGSIDMCTLPIGFRPSRRVDCGVVQTGGRRIVATLLTSGVLSFNFHDTMPSSTGIYTGFIFPL